MRTIKDFESIYFKMFKRHENEQYNRFENDVLNAIKAEIERQNGFGDMESYKPIYRRVCNWHAEHASPKNQKDWEKLVDSLIQFNESSEFECTLIIAAVREIERNYYDKKTNGVID